MKNFKSKSILFSLIAFEIITVLFSSCEKTDQLQSDSKPKIEIPSDVQNHIKEQGEISFYLPSDMVDADEKILEAYIASLTIEQIKARQESYKIYNYLGSIDRLEQVYNDLGQGYLLKKSDLIKYTSDQELADYNSFDVNSEIESRGCTTLWSGCYRDYRFSYKFCCHWWVVCYYKVTISSGC